MTRSALASLGRALFALVLVLPIAGCPGPEELPADGGDLDTLPVDALRHDAPPTDGSILCVVDDDCDDGVYCNGDETCDPSDPDADPTGCVDATASRCPTGETCLETTEMCTPCTTSGDGDGDGERSVACGGADCDDNDPSRRPGATEVCDAMNRDEDCDPTTFGFRDQDMDDAPDARCCNEDTAGELVCGDDCNDMRASVSPTATEACNGLDDDCDTRADEGVTTRYYVDDDGDLYGVDDATTNMDGCTPPPGYSITPGDCDDVLGYVHPTATDRCDTDGPGGTGIDDDCNGTPNDPPMGCTCTIGTTPRMCDGALGVCASGNESCDGGTWGSCSISPTASEVCDGRDEDCDGVVDDGVTTTCWGDADGDTYASAGAPMVTRCPDPSRPTVGGCPVGYTNREPFGTAEDCDDGRRDSSPGAAELCNGLNDDCDAATDEGLIVTCYTDLDNDTYAAPGAMPQALCPVAGRPMVGGCMAGTTNRTPTVSDCEDLDSTRSPGTLETCNGIDDDCDGTPDDGVGVMCYVDADGDTYALAGTPAMPVCPDPSRPAVGGCPVGRTNRAPMGVGSQDCNDVSAALSPAEAEVCEVPPLDNDCDGMTNEGVGITCYPDADNDGYAPTGATSSSVCPDPSRPSVGNCPINYTNRAATGSMIDCADGNPSVHPGVAEACDGIDNNCAGGIDEGVGMTYYRDGDDDGYGDPGLSMFLCNPPNGYVTNNTDCNDAVSSVRPGATEVCDDFDNDCDGTTNEGFATSTYYRDADHDNHGTPLATRVQCGAYGGYVSTNDDCDDTNANRYGGASEICGNGIDEDCTGVADDNTPRWYRDFDGDTYGRDAGSVVQCTAPTSGTWVSRGGDCRDDVGFASVNPGAMELCDGYDTDCTTSANASEGEIPSSFGLNHPLEDNDGDGHGDDACTTPVGAADGTDDCNDAANDVYTGATEIVGNGVDNNCISGEICFVDADNDGYRHTVTTMTVVSSDADCADAGEGALAEPATDCNDGNAAISPGDAEIADNAIDDNCSGAFGCWYDADNDGYSRSDAAIRDDSTNSSCADAGEGATAEPRTDCNDGNAAVSPGDPEVADNTLDDDCDTLFGCFYDADDDGYSRADAAVRDDSVDPGCTASGEGSTAEPRTDCVDTSAAAYPGAPLVADDGLDNNCNGSHECWYDADNDGYSRSDAAIRDDSTNASCTSTGEGSTSEPRTDCNDSNANVSPGDAEIPDNNTDENCSGFYGCYYDSDDDGYSRSDGAVLDTSTDTDCNDNNEGSSSEPRTDCCDTSTSTYPGSPSWSTATSCGSYDRDCNGSVVQRYTWLTPPPWACSDFTTMTTCLDHAYFTFGAVPACGGSQAGRDCYWAASACVLRASAVLIYQQCR